MKKFFCAALALLMILGCTPVLAASVTDSDLNTDAPPPSTETGLPYVDDPAAVDPEAQDWDGVISDFFSEHKISPDTVTLGYYNTVTGEEHYFRGDVQMTAASVNKLPLNMYFAEKLYKGEISWDSTYGGLPYRQVQEMSLRFSNNEYTTMLINSIGTYPDYRRVICPYIGVDADEQEYGFFTVNEFTAQQIMYCLKLLAKDPERYPGVMENLSLATPGEYFEQLVDEYDVAQKYGWYVLDGHNYINCVGIVDTPEPILLAIFTDNCAMGKNILGEYCALMCRYTEADIALRAEAEAERLAAEQAEAERLAAEEAERLAAEEAERAEAEAQAPTPAPDDETDSADALPVEDSSANAENALRAVACILGCAVLAVALGLAFRKKHSAAEAEERPGALRNILSAVLGLAAIAAVAFTLVTAARGLEAKPVIMSEKNDPAEVAEKFISLVLDGDAAGAEKLLLGSGRLGLDGEPTDELGRMLYTALRESFGYELKGDCVQDSTEASQSFVITYLDIPSVTALQQEATNARLARYLEAADRADEVQAEDGSWLPEVAMSALEEVTAELLQNAEEHYTQRELRLDLRYSGGEWKVIANTELFAILSGNTAY